MFLEMFSPYEYVFGNIIAEIKKTTSLGYTQGHVSAPIMES